MRASFRNSAAAAGILLMGAVSASAAPTANPAGRWGGERFFVAADFDYVLEKDIDPDGRARSAEIEDVTTISVRPAYSITQNMIAYARLGFREADGVDGGFTGGVGAQLTFPIPVAPEWAVGGSVEFLFWDGEAEGGDDLDWLEYQAASAVSYNVPQIPQLTPYAGAFLDFVDADGFGEEDVFGLLFGANYDLGSQFRLDAQFRVVAETAFFLSGGYMF